MTTPDTSNEATNRWADLKPRVLSAIVMAVVGGVDIWLGGEFFLLLVVVLTGVMLWELATISAGGQRAFGRSAATLSLILASIGALCLLLSLFVPLWLAAVLLLMPPLAFALTPRKIRPAAAIWAFAALMTGFGLITLRNDAGIPAILWIVLVVVVSDVMGYFAGRILGGPKFWPAISPKKTWSGTVAGWVGAAVVGLAFWALGYAPFGIVLLSPLVSFAGQMGDIAESWIKRRTGVKDSSNLIPGHGGFLDRFDAMTGAVALLVLLSLLVGLPLPVGG